MEEENSNPYLGKESLSIVTEDLPVAFRKDISFLSFIIHNVRIPCHDETALLVPLLPTGCGLPKRRMVAKVPEEQTLPQQVVLTNGHPAVSRQR